MKFDLNIYGPGRPLLPETRKRMEAMLRAIEKEPGIQSARLAKSLGIASIEAANLSRKRGLIEVRTVQNSRCYWIKAEKAA